MPAYFSARRCSLSVCATRRRQQCEQRTNSTRSIQLSFFILLCVFLAEREREGEGALLRGTVSRNSNTQIRTECHPKCSLGSAFGILFITTGCCIFGPFRAQSDRCMPAARVQLAPIINSLMVQWRGILRRFSGTRNSGRLTSRQDADSPHVVC